MEVRSSSSIANSSDFVIPSEAGNRQFAAKSRALRFAQDDNFSRGSKAGTNDYSQIANSQESKAKSQKPKAKSQEHGSYADTFQKGFILPNLFGESCKTGFDGSAVVAALSLWSGA